MRSRLIGIALVALVLTTSAYANAVFCEGKSCTFSGQQINFPTDQTGTTLTGTVVGTSDMVQFSSSQMLEVKHGTGKEIDPVRPLTKITNMTIMSTGNIFTGLRFDPFHEDTHDLVVVVTMSDGTTSNITIGGASQDFLTITTQNNEKISKVTMNSPSGFTSLRDYLIAGVAPAPPPIPEPSSMLLLGSGVLGLAQLLRRRRL